MSLDKAIKAGKEHRKEYRGAKAIDKTCRNHGSCDWCRENREHKNKKRLLQMEEASQIKKLSRKPAVKNKYNLTIADVKKLVVGDRTKIKEPLFWRNNVISAWCIIESVGEYEDSEYWIGIYDDDAPAYTVKWSAYADIYNSDFPHGKNPDQGKFRFYFSTYGGMCGYEFTRFFDASEIENEYDLQIQEKFLEKINYLIDEGILVIPKERWREKVK